MIRSGYLGFLLFAGLMVVFFVIPDPEGLQKPFRIALGLLFAFIYFSLLLKHELPLKTLWPIGLGGAILLLMVWRGTIQSSFVNAYLCLFGLLSMPKLFFELLPTRKINLNYIHLLAVLSILLQFMVFSSGDGRPRLAYEINLSGAYLFLFFLTSDILKVKYGKLLVMVLSLLTLSRLLVFSILIFYLVKYTKEYFRGFLSRMSATKLALISYLLIALFSLWYTATIKSDLPYETGLSRLTNLNDGSNKLRFIANTLVMGIVYNAPFSANVLFGFGPVANFVDATAGAIVMPHNELYDAIVQFGLLTVIIFSLCTLPMFNKVTSFVNMEYLIPLLFYTLILWVRYFLIPSFEMLFILFLLHLVKTESPAESRTGELTG